MKSLPPSEQFIAVLTDMHCGPEASADDRKAYRAALRALVRLGQAEQRQEMEAALARVRSIAALDYRI